MISVVENVVFFGVMDIYLYPTSLQHYLSREFLRIQTLEECQQYPTGSFGALVVVVIGPIWEGKDYSGQFRTKHHAVHSIAAYYLLTFLMVVYGDHSWPLMYHENCSFWSRCGFVSESIVGSSVASWKAILETKRLQIFRSDHKIVHPKALLRCLENGDGKNSDYSGTNSVLED